MKDTVTVPLWLSFDDRFTITRIEWQQLPSVQRLDEAYREGRALWLKGRYFHVEKAKLDIRQKLDEAHRWQ